MVLILILKSIFALFTSNNISHISFDFLSLSRVLFTRIKEGGVREDDTIVSLTFSDLFNHNWKL